MTTSIHLSLSPSGGLTATSTSAKGNDLSVELPTNASEALTVLYRMLLAASRGKASLASPQHPTDTMARDLTDARWGDLRVVRYGQGSNAKPLPANAEEIGL